VSGSFPVHKLKHRNDSVAKSTGGASAKQPIRGLGCFLVKQLSASDAPMSHVPLVALYKSTKGFVVCIEALHVPVTG
jgi:hypothetical protein